MHVLTLPRAEYPRPHFVRSRWTCLNGTWQFAREEVSVWHAPMDVQWESEIIVPFAPEAPASGLADERFHAVVWYRRTFDMPALADGERLLLHFGAVDYAATVWVNGIEVASHEGGYTPFSADITDAATRNGAQTVVVRAEDDPTDLTKPRGKQDWEREPHAIWYPRTSGIWQTVWLEPVPATAIRTVAWTPNIERYEIALEGTTSGPLSTGAHLQVVMWLGDKLLADDTYAVIVGEVSRRIAFSDPGIDDSRSDILWSPEHPRLINFTLRLLDASGVVLDTVEGYTALRDVGVLGNRFLLNGRSRRLLFVLDQGYWPEGGLTAPTDEDFIRDIELVKAMGFNGVRKHQKIEDPRYLYHADRIGILVWEEMPSTYRFTRTSVTRVLREWQEVIARDRDHPCIIVWVPFNESWGVPHLPGVAAQRDYIQTAYHLTKTLDATRAVIGNDGWEHVATDIVGIHDYDTDVARLARRYASPEAVPHLFADEQPAGRVLALGNTQISALPLMLTEFGGIAFSADPAHTWGYTRAANAEGFTAQYTQLIQTVRKLPILAGFCYTQFADTYQEVNGLLYADRTPKIPLDVIANANYGPLPT